MFSAWRRVDRNAPRVVENQGFDGDWRLESSVTMGACLSSREDKSGVVSGQERSKRFRRISYELRGFQVCQKRANIYGV